MPTKCPKCHTENPDTLKFCGQCGTQLTPDGQPPSMTKTLESPTYSLTKGSLVAGKYRVLKEIGRGGMGIVYEAEDIKLARKIAIKVLPEAFTNDPERLARFEREAKVLASLNHPNIAAIYGVEEADGKRFLVLELVEGETLADRLSRGALNLEETLDVCDQISQGLEGAHEKSIIHRDLKPSNIKITPEGKVKILDFGLARAFHDQLSDIDLAKSPTITADMTRPGVILGTAAYMSPEQAKGKSVDKRADIWAFGCILYECMTGRRAFAGETITETIAAVLKSDPDFTLLPPENLPVVSPVLRRCLQKDPSLRLRDIADVRLELRDLLAGAPLEVEPGIARKVSSSGRRLMWGFATLAVVAIAVAAWALLLRPRPAPLPFYANLEARITDVFSASPPFAISPSGLRVVFVSEFQNEQVLFSRRLDQSDEAAPLAGTEDARNPFFSPDGHTVCFFSRRRLMGVPVSGGLARIICDVPTDYSSGSWGPDDTIVFGTFYTETGLFRVPASGGKAEILTSPRGDQGEIDHRSPFFLPGGELLLFTVVERDFSKRTAVLTLETQDWEILNIPGYARYISPGYLIYHDSGKLFAQSFDLSKISLTGPPLEVVGNVYRPHQSNVSAYFDISDTGILLYLSTGTPKRGQELVWISKTGEVTPVRLEGSISERPRLSPDGRTFAAPQISGAGTAIFLYDLESGHRKKLRSSRSGVAPIWFPNSQQVAFSAPDSSGTNLYWNSIEAAGDAKLLFASPHPKWATDISGNGRYLAYYELNPKTGRDIWILPLQGEKKPEFFLGTPANERSAVFSPDGNWIAYASDESGRDEVYVQAFPKSQQGPRIVSTHSGREPMWSSDGRELYYRRRNQLVAVPVRTSPTFIPGQERVLFEGNFVEEIGGRNQYYSVSPDGQSFLMLRQGEGTTPQSLRIVFNWFEELKRLVSTRD